MTVRLSRRAGRRALPSTPSVLVPLLVLLLAVVAAFGGAGSAAAASDKPERLRKPVTGSVEVTTHRTFGVSTEGAPGGQELTDLVATLGRTPDEVMWFVAWGLRTGFPATDAERVRTLGATPVITWEPWDPSAGPEQTTYSMRSIAQGRHDTYLRSWARGVRAFGTPVVLRFAHEGNGTWYPWSPGVAGTTVADAVAAWRHVRTLFQKERALNAVFRWSPNVPFPGSTSIASLWPGATYVDQVALDGYNWAGTLPGTTWTSFRDVFAQGLQELSALTPLRVHVGETAAPEQGGDKATWIRDMFATLASDQRWAGTTWFHHDKELDWRITSSEAATDAFREGLATY